MTGKERLWRIFKNQEIDRPALKLWGLSQDTRLMHPAYKPVRDLANETTDIFFGGGSAFNLFLGRREKDFASYKDVPIRGTRRYDRHITWKTPKGELHAVDRRSRDGEPPYMMENLVKTAEDMERVLSVPYEPFPFDANPYYEATEAAGERGLATFGLDHAGYALHRLMGSEKLAVMSVDNRDVLHAALEVFHARIMEHTRSAVKAGIPGPYAWVGPELLIPPLMSPVDFRDFVFAYDKPVCDEIHNGGGYVWVHCHGKVNSFIDDFAEMGVDVLNPLEPDNCVNGDVDLLSVAKRYGGRIGLEGNIENQTLLQADAQTVGSEIDRCAEALKTCGRGILCASSGYMEYPFPTELYIENLLLYLKRGLAALTA